MALNTNTLRQTGQTITKLVEQKKIEDAKKEADVEKIVGNKSLIGAKIGSSLGFTIGIVYAFKVKSGFWKGWGYAILGSIALGGLGYGIGMAIKNKDVVIEKTDRA
jgi:hypothetical protein